MTVKLTRVQKRAHTRSALLEAGANLFVERGLAGTSVEAIAAEAGFTRGAFYSNFSSKEELFVEVLQERVYAAYRAMIEGQLEQRGPLPTARKSAERLAKVQAHPDGRWLFRLWLELLLQAGRDDRMRVLASGFWRSNRELLTQLAARRQAEGSTLGGLAPDHAATALIAMDIGLAIQHFVDPEAVPLDAYPTIFGALFDK